MGSFGDDMREFTAWKKEKIERIRDERLKRFETEVLPKLQRKYGGELHDNGTRYVVYDTSLGTITIYPKANKMLIHNENTWHKPAVQLLYAYGII